MGDMGDTFNAMREATKEHRRAMLAKADTSQWTRHTDYHFSRIFGPTHDPNGGRIDWYPSTGKAMITDAKGKRMIYGHKRVNALIRRTFG